MALINSNQLHKNSNIDVKNFPDAETLQCVRDAEPIISFTPPTHTVIHRPMVNLSEFLSSYSICLNSYEDRIGVSVKGEKLCTDRLASLKEIIRTHSKRQRHDSGGGGGASEKKSPDCKRIKCETNELKQLLVDTNNKPIVTDSEEIKSEQCLHKMNSTFEIDGVTQITFSSNELKDDIELIEASKSAFCTDTNSLKDDLIKTPLSNGYEELKTEQIEKEQQNEGIIKPDKVPKKKEPKSHALPKKKEKKEHFRPLLDDETIKEIKKGWNLVDVGDLTIGDLYIMFGNDFKVDLEYSWVSVPIKKEISAEIKIECPIEVKSEPVVVCSTMPPVSQPPQIAQIIQNNSLGSKLKQLLMLANMAEKTRKRVNCTCGHFCDKGFKSKVIKNILIFPENE